MARVLVVDDDPDILRVVEKVLRMQGHDVFTAYDAMKAMDLLNCSLYDLLITDATMPRFSGFELARTVKNNKRFQRMAICMLTGLREKKDIEKAIRAGVDDYIVKPIDPMLLLQKVESIFAKKPPMEKATYDVPDNLRYADAKITFDARIIHISELGLVIRSPLEISDNVSIQLMSELFKKMDIATIPPVKTITSRKVSDIEYELSMAFLGINDSFQQKIRAWIHDQNQKKRAAA